jgi:hypothetical protein
MVPDASTSNDPLPDRVFYFPPGDHIMNYSFQLTYAHKYAFYTENVVPQHNFTVQIVVTDPMGLVFPLFHSGYSPENGTEYTTFFTPAQSGIYRVVYLIETLFDLNLHIMVRDIANNVIDQYVRNPLYAAIVTVTDNNSIHFFYPRVASDTFYGFRLIRITPILRSVYPTYTDQVLPYVSLSLQTSNCTFPLVAGLMTAPYGASAPGFDQEIGTAFAEQVKITVTWEPPDGATALPNMNFIFIFYEQGLVGDGPDGDGEGGQGFSERLGDAFSVETTHEEGLTVVLVSGGLLLALGGVVAVKKNQTGFATRELTDTDWMMRLYDAH